MDKKFLKGFLFGTLGVTLVSSLNHIIALCTDYIDSQIGLKITQNSIKINDMNEPKRAIGFSEEGEEMDERY